MDIPLDVGYFLDLKTASGIPVGKLRLLNGNHLVWKIPMPEKIGKCGLRMPDQYRARAVGNLCAIKGFIVRASEPWTRKKVKRTWVWDEKAGQEMPRYKAVDAAHGPSDVKAGDCVLYNSYNMGQIEVVGLPTYLVVVREIDMEASWTPDRDTQVELGDWAMKQAKAVR